MPLSPNTRLGVYEIIGPLGAGGMGEVYRARDTRLRRDVAIKVLPDAVASSPDRLVRFEREATTVAALNHPNIVTLHSIEEIDGIRFLTMELVEGRTVSTLITPGGLPVGQVLDLAIPLADALAAAHEKRVVHRDLKPSNVMVTREGRVKVLDFGIAKLMRGAPDLESTQAETFAEPFFRVGEVVGTVPYMSPEQIRGEDVDARTDIYAFGVLLFELVSGKCPFTGDSLADVASAILRDRPPDLTGSRSDLPSDMPRIIRRCLEKQPRERFQTALDVQNELRELKRTLEHDAPRPSNASPEQIASIAVLPFANRSASAEDEYFSDGLADELLQVLAKIRGLRVAARTSAFHFKGRDTTIAEIGRTLNVATVLEGSVRKAGQRVRISVQLVNVSDGYHVWSETYDRTLEDILAVQGDIAQSVVEALRATLLGEEADAKTSGEVKAEVSKAAQGRASHPEAHRLFLQARYLIERYTAEDLGKAIEYLKQALKIDAKFALAWAELGWAHAKEADYGWVPAAEGYRRAREAVRQALELEPDLAEAHATMAWIQMVHDWDWRGAERSFRRSLQLAPQNAAALRRAGVLAINRGRIDEGMDFYRRALEQDPLDAHCYSNMASSLFTAGRYEEAEAACRKALEFVPQKMGVRGLLSVVLLRQGRSEEALKEAMSEGDESTRLWALAIIQHELQHTLESDDALRTLIERFADSFAFSIAEVYGSRGNAEAAFNWLDRAYKQRETALSGIKHSACLRSLHGDPQWQPFLQKMGLAEE